MSFNLDGNYRPKATVDRCPHLAIIINGSKRPRVNVHKMTHEAVPIQPNQ